MQELIHICSDLLVRARTSYKELEEVTAKASSIVSGKERARFYYESVIPRMNSLREPVDRLEMLVDKDLWPMPSYGDLLFEI